MFPDFPAFFNALWPGKEPFPWQTMLAERAAATGWPDAIDLPTASGKTACLDIAIWALAQQAKQPTRHTPRRIWFVVDRRIVVDEAFDRARKIADKLATPDSDALRAVAERLFDLRGLPNRKDRPLAVGRLRGGILRDDRWARLPSQPAILTSTVDQLGSRLLFRGYGHSTLAAPIFAGLAGNDSLILLDEAHCAQPFLQTLRAVQRFRSEKWSEVANSTPFHIAVLSATPPTAEDGELLTVFPADDEERMRALDHPVLQARLIAKKLTSLQAVKQEEHLAEAIATAAKDFADKGSKRIGIIVNRVARAMAIKATLDDLAKKETDAGKLAPFDVELLTGRIRPIERDTLVGEKLHPVLHSSPQRDPERPLILVSTQCLEVGADFSFDTLVTECASLDALRQRFGRLARLGEPNPSHAIIFAAESALKEADPIYGDTLRATWKFLWEEAEVSSRKEGRKTIEERTRNFGFEALRALLPPPDSKELRDMLATSPDAPILLPAHLDLLCQTAPLPHPDPDIGAFLHGKGRSGAEVRVALRCDLDPARTDDWPEIASLCPPVSGEMLTVPLHRLRQWLASDTTADTTGDVEGDVSEIHTDRAQTKHSLASPFLLYRGRERSEVSRDPAAIYPDSVILLAAPHDKPGLEQVRELGQVLGAIGLGAEHVDLWELAHQRAGKPPALRLHRAVLAPWLPHCPPLRLLLELVENTDPLRAELDEALDAILAWQPEGDPAQALPGWLSDLLTATRDYLVHDLARHPAGGIILRVRKQPSPADATDYLAEDDFDEEDDARSEAPDAVELVAHCTRVATIAEKFARACLGDGAASVLKLAGDWHDTGKLDPRFQAYLHGGLPPDSSAPLAKSPDKPRSRDQARDVREAVGLPADFRHEMLSTQLAEILCQAELSAHDRELLLHLIASHHGHARPFAPVCADIEPPAVGGRLPCGNVSLSAADRRALNPPHRLDSSLADRFCSLTRRHGWWGLAYREALLRLADWHASEHPAPATQPAQP